MPIKFHMIFGWLNITRNARIMADIQFGNIPVQEKFQGLMGMLIAIFVIKVTKFSKKLLQKV